MGEEKEYYAAGVSGEVLRERVSEFLEGAERKGRWALPVAAKWHRKGLKPVRWRWEGLETDEEGKGLRNRERVFEGVLKERVMG